MKEMRKYCGRTDNAEKDRKEKKEDESEEIIETLSHVDGSIVYVQENYVVMDCVFSKGNRILRNTRSYFVNFVNNLQGGQIHDH